MNDIFIPDKTDMSEVNLILHVLSNLPEEYEGFVVQLENDMQNRSTPLSIEDIKRVTSSRFECIPKHNDICNENEKAFAAWAKKKHEGICRNSGEY